MQAGTERVEQELPHRDRPLGTAGAAGVPLVARPPARTACSSPQVARLSLVLTDPRVRDEAWALIPAWKDPA
ncbi:hypothetical protein [Sphaerisporangium sp. TRM90804]|uniref:hypothetical protein n=1 Tax=Sphaerisporangium sp. TRM90804 TaxID=3031113 RepID=UPI002448A434|nr:hypothetical protein [Sphaerisporangium sp. TRM90804]MDH2428436.1 hypothetical protein [Sphaerisporangium sp. TRM90804]